MNNINQELKIIGKTQMMLTMIKMVTDVKTAFDGLISLMTLLKTGLFRNYWTEAQRKRYPLEIGYGIQ